MPTINLALCHFAVRLRGFLWAKAPPSASEYSTLFLWQRLDRLTNQFTEMQMYL